MIVAARLASLRLFSTVRGDRLYAVFKSADKGDLGLWFTPHQLQIDDLQLGDLVFLKLKKEGHWGLIFQPLPCDVQLRLFSWLNRRLRQQQGQSGSAHLDGV